MQGLDSGAHAHKLKIFNSYNDLLYDELIFVKGHKTAAI